MILLGQRPLTASDADHRLFANRSSELQRVQRALDLGLNAYVWGSPGSGRTSFLRQVERTRSDARYVRLHGLETLSARLDEVERALRSSEALPRDRVNPLGQALAAFTTTQYQIVADPLRHLKWVTSEQHDEGPFLVLVDDLDSKGCYEMFGRLRDNMWELPIQWVVTGTSAHLSEPTDTFFDVLVELPPFDQEGLDDLVRRRAKSGTTDERETLQSRADLALAAIAPCTPRRALSALRDLYLSDDIAEAANQLSRFQSARSGLKPTAAKVLDALMHSGPTHAGDEQLLAEVGVTRSRVVQILSELETKSLVTSRRVGRRKLYTVLSSQTTRVDPPSRLSRDRQAVQQSVAVRPELDVGRGLGVHEWQDRFNSPSPSDPNSMPC